MIESEKLYDILVCPITKQKLQAADKALVDSLNLKIARGELVMSSGQKIEEALTAVLISADAKTAYPIRDGIPVLLKEEAMSL